MGKKMFLKFKKTIFIFLFVFSCCSVSSFASTASPSSEFLIGKAATYEDEGYFILSDNSCWKVVGFVPRWRTISEWWAGTELLPAGYEVLPKDWSLGSVIEVYAKHQILSGNENNASNKDKLRSCTHLLICPNTGMTLFASPISSVDCMINASESSYNKGYNQGYHAGYSDGRSTTNAHEYNQGYDDGYSQAELDIHTSRH